MKIVVLGGTGLVGSKLVAKLREQDHEVVAAAPELGVDAVTGEGLTKALNGATVVVDASDSSCLDDGAAMSFFTTSTENLLEAEAEAGVKHHVALSTVVTEPLLKSGYFRARCVQETLIRKSSVPYSIIRATQFFESLRWIADVATHGDVVRVAPALIQPIAADDVTRVVARIAVGTPLNGAVELGGPEEFYLAGLLQRVLGATRESREVVLDAHARYFGAELDERALVAGDEAELGEIQFEDWLRHSAHHVAGPSAVMPIERAPLREHEFRVSEVPPGSVLLVGGVAVFSVAGGFCATQATCPHRAGLLSEGTVDNTTVTCPLHGAQFDIWTGAVLRGPAKDPLKTYSVIVEGDVGRVDVG